MTNPINFSWSEKSSLNKLEDDLFAKKGVELSVLREDLLHPFVSGNKIRKLKYFHQELVKKSKEGFISFGGAFSNHLHALSYYGKIFSVPTIGFVRGDCYKTEIKNNPTIKDMIDNGMDVRFLGLSEYKTKTDFYFLNDLEVNFPNYVIIPEGANHELGFLGCKEILDERCKDFDFIAISMGTGITTVGILESLEKNQKCMAVTSFKNHRQQLADISKFSKNIDKLEVFLSSDKTKFGDFSQELISFINQFYKKFKIMLDPIYNGKLFFTIFGMIENDIFKKGSKILIVHTGGLQGILGANQTIVKRKWKELIIY